MNNRSVIVKSFLLIVFIMGICVLSMFIYPRVRGMFISRDDGWKQKTTPLSMITVKELCIILESTEDELCREEQENVYAPDFFPIIDEVFNKRNTTYADVQKKISKYQTELEPLSKRSDGSNYFVSHYDFRGDGVSSILFFFYGDYQNNRLMKIIFIYGDEFGF